MLSRNSDRKPIAGDAKATSAASHTSSGHLLHVSFHLTPPPACSGFYHDWPGISDAAGRIQGPHIVAAHRDCLLLDVMSGDPDRWRETAVTDYFVFDAGADSRPPALLLLPTCFIPMLFQRKRNKQDDQYDDLMPLDDEEGDENLTLVDEPSCLWKDNTGIPRRGDGEVVVARLEVPKAAPRQKAEVCVLDTGRLKWETNRHVPIFHGELTAGEAEELMEWWETDEVVAVGDRFLCFVDYFRGFLLCDMAVAGDVSALELHYMPLPVEARRCPSFDDRPTMEMVRNLAAASATMVRFVTVDSRCCCGAHGNSTCERGQFLFTVTMWTLNLMIDDGSPATTWVKDSELDCEELWALPGYDGSLPRTGRLTWPIVSCDEPDVVCFVVRNGCRYGMSREDRKVWVLEIDMRRKALRSVIPYNEDEGQAGYKVAALLKC